MMKFEIVAAAETKKAIGNDADAPDRIAVFVVDYPKSGPVLESSFVFPKIESFGDWNIAIPTSPESVPANC